MFVRRPQFRNSNADVQIFYGSGTFVRAKSWIKPPGVSNIYMLLIGGGGDSDGTTAGGSGAVTVWYGAAQNVPDQLEIICRFGATNIQYKSSSQTLLSAQSGTRPSGGAAMIANAFANSGFFQSVLGQDSAAGSSQSASSTTFLSGGASAGTGGSITGNYGYSSGGTSSNGFFQFQPIIVGLGGNGSGRGGIGCGGGINGSGGPGMVLIASW